MINAKERFGYTYIISYDPIEQNILEAFCEGKSFLWKMYLGWRKTRIEKDGTETRFYWIPSNKVEILISLSKTLDKQTGI